MQRVVERRCVVCREQKPQNELIRVCRINKEFKIDIDHKLGGRGAYVCKNKQCIETCKKKRAFNKSFKTNVSDDIYNLIGDYEQSN